LAKPVANVIKSGLREYWLRRYDVNYY